LYNLSDFAQSNLSNQATIANGKLIFSGTQFYSGGNSYYNFFHNGSDYTIFLSIVSKQNNSSGTILANNNFSSPIGFGLLLDDRDSQSRSQQVRTRTRGASGNIVNDGVDDTLTENSLVNSCITYDFTNATAGGTAGDIYKNGSLHGTYDNISKAASTSDVTTAMRLGSSSGGGGLVAELQAIVVTANVWPVKHVEDITHYFS
jgi:hypothetical protein